MASYSERLLLSLPPLHEGLVASDQQMSYPTSLLVSAHDPHTSTTPHFVNFDWLQKESSDTKHVPHTVEH
jgi:hypothetical protein